MSAGDDRHARPTHEFDSVELAKLAKLTEREIVSIPIDAVEDPFCGWDDEVIADGTPLRSAGPLISRTQTIADPLTTGLLAEVSRRAETADIAADGPNFDVDATWDLDPDELPR